MFGWLYVDLRTLLLFLHLLGSPAGVSPSVFLGETKRAVCVLHSELLEPQGRTHCFFHVPESVTWSLVFWVRMSPGSDVGSSYRGELWL